MDGKGVIGCAKADLAVLARNKPVLIGLLLLPCLIFLLYVGAYYQPITNAENTEVLLCNMDGSGLSNTVADAIMATNSFKFRRASYEDGLSSVQSGDAWALLVIPSDFSSRFENGENPQIRMVLDDQRSYIIARVLTPSFDVMMEKLNAKLSEEYSDEIAEGLGAAASQTQLSSVQLGTLSASSKLLSSSSSQVALGTGTASTYLSELSLSEGKLATGLKKAAYSSGVLSGSLSQLSGASATLQESTGTLKSAAEQVSTANTAEQSYLLSAISSANSLPDSAERNFTLLALQNAYNLSLKQGSGLNTTKNGLATLYSSQGVLSGKLGEASTGAFNLSTSLYDAYSAQSTASSSTGQASSSLTTASGASSRIATGQGQAGRAAGLLSQKDSALSGKLGEASDAAASLSEVKFSIVETNASSYGTFFATAFIVLGLFLGSVSAYVLCCLDRLRRPFGACVAIVVVQCVILLSVYLAMDFPARGGVASLLAVMMLTGLLFALLVRAFCKALSPKITAEHLQVISPVMTLLAVFMLSSGGVIWPQHTLQWPFSLFAPYIPFNYSVTAIRASALSGSVPVAQAWAMLAFSAAFILMAKAFGEKGAIAAAVRKAKLSI
ncbi:MAG: ABC transporter permease [Candidatus Micrarchaeia archaeon]